ncbi:MAG: GntR family transcriptional regulator [Akkermansiaceae bacterium]
MKQSLPKRVHLALRARLFDGSLPPGARLDYKQLARELGVSVTPIREAVAQLASEGFIELIPRLGAIVRKLNRTSALEFYEVREAVETFAALKAAERHSPMHLEQLRRHLAVMQRISDNAPSCKTTALEKTGLLSFLESDIAFHRTILLGSRNSALARTVVESQVQLQIFYAARGAHDGSRVALVCEQHQTILTAVEKRDGPAAAEAMRLHIRASLDFTLDHLESALDD